MSNFATKSIRAVKGKQQFRQLVILSTYENKQEKIEKEKGQLDIYEESLEIRYQPLFNRVLSIINAVANCESLPQNQWKNVTPKKESIKEYEIKAGDLRLFAIDAPNGKILILGGYKNQQEKDFKRFRSLKKQYIESLNK